LTQENYEIYVEWLNKEPDTTLIVPAIREDIAENKLSKEEIDSLRTRVVTIKKYGHEKYLKLAPEEIALEVFGEAKILNDEKRERGNCCERIR